VLTLINEFLQGNSVWVYGVIFTGKLIEVSLSSLCCQLIVKGEKWRGAVCAAFQYCIWFIITANVINGAASDPLRLGLLITAYAFGQVTGSLLEQKLALGNCMVCCVFMEQEKAQTAELMLRSQGFALTTFSASGRNESHRAVQLLTVRRKLVPLVKKLAEAADPSVVITVTQSVEMERGTLINKPCR